VIDKQKKVEYVKKQTQFRNHHCHWPGCKKQVPPAMWGCYKHWMILPKTLRDKIWAAYRPGQEKDMRPSRHYLTVATEVQNWITNYLRKQSNANDSTKRTKRKRDPK
jgi:CDP-diacylglycerol pyrophosphatase